MNKNKILSGGGNIWQGEGSGVGGGGKCGERGREVGIWYPPVHPLISESSSGPGFSSIQNAAKMMHCENHTYSLCINQILPSYSFTLLPLTFSAISFHHFCIIYWLSIFENPVSRILFNYWFLNIHIWKAVPVTCIFKNWLFADWELADICKMVHVHVPKYLCDSSHMVREMKKTIH